jgi:hypothetical protein
MVVIIDGTKRIKRPPFQVFELYQGLDRLWRDFFGRWQNR